MVATDMHPGIARDAGERRVVTVLFADLVSSTVITVGLDPDDTQVLFDQAMARMAGAVHKFGGIVVRYQGDGIMAVFGAPEPAEDHALRACFAGLAIQEAFEASDEPVGEKNVPLQVRVGIHSGLVITRDLQSDVGGGLDLVGASVSVAALAEKVCPVGAVTATTIAAELAAEFISTRHLEVTNRAIPGGFVFVEVLAASLTAQTVGIVAESDLFVGRDDEEAKVRGALDLIESGGQVIGILGDAGIGKSRLAYQIARHARRRQFPVYEIRGLSLTQATPYKPLGRFISALLELHGNVTEDAICRALERFDLSDVDQRLIVRFLGASAEEPGAGHGQRNVDRNALSHALASIIHAVLCETPALVVTEDLHFLDTETAVCMGRVAKRIAATKALILVTGRNDAEEAMARLAPASIQLTPLDRAALRKIVASISPTIAEKDELADELINRSGGVPFVLEQILRTIQDQDISSEIPILPHKVESIVHTRLNQLSDEAKPIAKKLSILGDEFDYGLAHMFLAGTEPNLDKALVELERAGFMLASASNIIRFKHSIIRESCLDSIVQAERSPLHAKAIECLEERYEDVSPYYEQLAYHSERADRNDLALEYLWNAARFAAQQSAVHSLGIIYDRAIACCERLGAAAESREVDFVLLAFDAMQQHGKIASVIPRLERAAQLAE
ncbi:MAG: AAA family ATPase, partial [Gammaproteobacteria bacterium]|nr:AAA family ATPase [Gammaproteobacteria bacterium]